MKIKCYTHDRRVMTIPSGKDESIQILIHRNDGSHCESKSVVVGEKLMRLGTWQTLKVPVEDESIVLDRVV